MKRMIKLLRPGIAAAAAAGLLFHLTAQAAPLTWQTNRTAALQAARSSGKLILLMGGRETCPNCQYMKYTVCETPSVRQLIDTNYVCWFSSVDDSTEWVTYAAGLGAFTLPLLCVIDPGDSAKYLDRSTATATPTIFQARLRSHLPANAAAPTLLRGTPARLRWTTESQVKYRILRSDNLSRWLFAGTVISGDGSPAEFVDPTPTNQ